MLGPAAGKRFLLLLIGLAVMTGIFARAAHLDRKLFWQDEAVAALHISGHDFDQIHRLYDGRVHAQPEIQALVERAPGSNIGTMLRTLSIEDAHISPLFYVIDRLTLEAAGNGSATVYRLPSAIAGILSIGFAFAFGVKLFRSRLGGGMLAALVAVSPFHIMYARQTREYALFGMFVLASSYFLLRALERRTLLGWVAYAVAVGLALNADSLSALVLVAHATYVVVMHRRESRVLGAYALATAAGAMTYAPWALNGLRASHKVSGELFWGTNAYPVKFFGEKWLFNIAAVFFDTEFASLRLFGFVAAIALAILIAAITIVARSGGRRTQTLGFGLTIFPIGAFVALDLLHGSHFSTIPRYLTAGWIGLEVIVAGALSSEIASGKRFAPLAFSFLMVAGIGAALYDNTQENWWDNNNQVAYQAVARTIDATPRPLLLVYDFYELPIMLSRYLNPDASFLFYHAAGAATIPAGTKHAFILVPSARILNGLDGTYGARYGFYNVSPNASNAISRFHVELRHDKTFRRQAFLDNQLPGNALWSIEAH